MGTDVFEIKLTLIHDQLIYEKEAEYIMEKKDNFFTEKVEN